MAKFDFTSEKKLRKIPILITKESKHEWRIEIADNYEDYKPTVCNKINFEDIGFHFSLEHETTDHDSYLYNKKSDVMDIAKYINEKYLDNKGKIWNCK